MVSTSSVDERVLTALVRKQQERFPKILEELEAERRKTSHWIWWACPTELPGDCDPIASYVTMETAGRLLTSEASDQWRQVLEKLCELLEESGTAVLPRIDHGRIHYFLKFWDGVPQKPQWMPQSPPHHAFCKSGHSG